MNIRYKLNDQHLLYHVSCMRQNCCNAICFSRCPKELFLSRVRLRKAVRIGHLYLGYSCKIFLLFHVSLILTILPLPPITRLVLRCPLDLLVPSSFKCPGLLFPNVSWRVPTQLDVFWRVLTQPDVSQLVTTAAHGSHGLPIPILPQTQFSQRSKTHFHPKPKI